MRAELDVIKVDMPALDLSKISFFTKNGVRLLVGQMLIYLVKIRLGEINCVTRLKG
jgi:hypothetical protein